MRATGGSLQPLVVMVVAILFVHRAQCRSRQITRINKWYKVACIPEHIKVRQGCNLTKATNWSVKTRKAFFETSVYDGFVNHKSTFYTVITAGDRPLHLWLARVRALPSRLDGRDARLHDPSLRATVLRERQLHTTQHLHLRGGLVRSRLLKVCLPARLRQRGLPPALRVHLPARMARNALQQTWFLFLSSQQMIVQLNSYVTYLIPLGSNRW